MKKSFIFLILGIVFFLISFLLFGTLKEIVTPGCLTTCGKFINYVDAFTPEFVCNDLCRVNSNNQIITYHSVMYVIFVWLGIISIIIGFILLITKK